MGEKITQEDQSIMLERRGTNAEHLAEGFYPIMASVGTYQEHKAAIEAINTLEEIKFSGHNANFSAHPDLLDMQGFKTSLKGGYVISPLDEKAKFTEGLYNCTSLVAVGREKGTGRELSFLTHQKPDKISLDGDFATDLKSQLQELKDRCEEGSVDVIISGGQFFTKFIQQYEDSLKILDHLVRDVLGFEPIVIVGPKGEYDKSEKKVDVFKDNIYFDTQKRRMYDVRPENQDLYNENFKPDKIKEMEDKWKAEEVERKEKHPERYKERPWPTKGVEI